MPPSRAFMTGRCTMPTRSEAALAPKRRLVTQALPDWAQSGQQQSVGRYLLPLRLRQAPDCIRRSYTSPTEAVSGFPHTSLHTTPPAGTSSGRTFWVDTYRTRRPCSGASSTSAVQPITFTSTTPTTGIWSANLPLPVKSHRRRWWPTPMAQAPLCSSVTVELAADRRTVETFGLSLEPATLQARAISSGSSTRSEAHRGALLDRLATIHRPLTLSTA